MRTLPRSWRCPARGVGDVSTVLRGTRSKGENGGGQGVGEACAHMSDMEEAYNAGWSVLTRSDGDVWLLNTEFVDCIFHAVSLVMYVILGCPVLPKSGTW